jgi:hypothetical protein
MLSGRLPFWQPEVHAILEQVIQGEPTPLARDVAHCIPREVDKVLRRALSKRREDRFPTITAMARAFEAAAGVSVPVPAPASRPARSVPASRPARRSRTGLWLLLVAAALAAGAGWMFRDDIMSSKWWPGGAAAERGAASDPSNASDDRDHRRRRPAQRH